MINLDNFPKIKNDLSGNLTTAQYLVAIKTDPVIYISTTKQMFQSTDGTEGYGGNLLQDSGFNANNIWELSGDAIIEDGVGKFLGLGEYSHFKIPNLLELGEEYRIKINCIEKEEPSTIRISQWAAEGDPTYEVVPENQTGVWSKTFIPDVTEDLKIYIGDGTSNWDKSATIDNVILQKLGIQPVYYEDLDLKVSNIKEKIDLKTKKIQLSSMSLSFNNFPVNDVRLSDRMGNGLGKEISVYLKTASCESIEDCVKVADLKVNRYSHDKNTVKIGAEDKWLESFYVDLPKKVLEKDVNTFEAYNLKPVPILYGHLENAPAIPYYSESEDYSFVEDGIRVLFDSSYNLGNAEVQGVKIWNNDDGNRAEEEMKDPNIFKVKMSDSVMASIPVVPFINTRSEVKDIHTSEQYQTYHDYISITSLGDKYSDSYPDTSNLVSMWCSYNSKLVNEKKSMFSVVTKILDESALGGEERGQINRPTYVYGDTLKYLSSGYKYRWMEWDQSSLQYIVFASFWMWNYGLYELEFEPLNGIDVYRDENSDEPTVSDVNIIGDSLYRYTWSGNESFSTFKSIAIYSPVKYDEEYQALPNGNLHADKNLGTPSSWNFIDDSDYSLWSTDHLDGWLDVLEGKDRNTFKIKGLADSGSGYLEHPYSQYVSYFNSKYSDINKFNSSYSNNEYPTMQSNNVSLYYTITDDDMSQPSGQGDNGWQATARVWMETKWNNVELRKYWKNKDIFSKDLFVNAKGRIGSTVNNSIDVQAEIKVFYEGADEPTDFTSHENKHLIELYKALTDSSMKYKNIGGEVYELMLYHKIGSREHYLYDIDVNNFEAKTDIDSLGDFDAVFTDDNGVVQPYYGWIFEVTAKNFGGSHLPNSQPWTNEDVSFFGGFDLIYGKINYLNGDIDSITVSTHDTLNEFNGSNSFQGMNATGKSYVKIYHESDEVSRKLLESPEDIIGNLINTEMNAGSVVMPTQETNMAFGFSINEQENSKDIIENICSQSNLFFRYSPRDGQAIIDTIKRVYSLGDIDKTISSDKILKYSFSKTKVDDLCFNGCKVRWGYDYGKEELANITGETSVSDEYIESYINEYGLEGADDISKFRESGKYKLEIEAPYINNEATAEKLRDFMFQFYKNTHLIIKATLPIQEGIELEVGDLVGFDKNIGDLKPYGKDMYQNLNLNGEAGYMQIDQQILPYFLITSVSKTLDKVDIEVMQVHNLTGTPIIYGCKLPGYLTSNLEAHVHVQSMCTDLIVEGCTHPSADNYDQNANVDDGSCVFPNASPIATFHTYIYDQNDEESTSLYSGGYLEFDASDSYDPNGNIGYNGIVSFQWDLEITYEGQVIDTPNELQNSVDIANQATSSAGYTGSYWLSIYPMVDHIGFGIKASLTVEDSEGATSTVASIAPIIVNEAGVLPDDDGEQEGTGVLGDVTQDGVVDVLDIVTLVQYVLGNDTLTDIQLLHADYNNSGTADVLDIVALTSQVLGNN